MCEIEQTCRDLEQELESGNAREVSLQERLSGLYITSINVRVYQLMITTQYPKDWLLISSFVEKKMYILAEQ